MHLPKTIINKLIPFFPKHHYKEIVKQAKASLDTSTKKGCLEVANGNSWATPKVESKKEKVESFDSLLPTFYFLLPT